MLRQLIVEATNACNSTCIFCPNRLSARPVEHIDLSLYSKIIKEVRQLGFATDDLSVGLCGIGDPLMHPEFPALLEIAKSHGVPVGVGSNGGLLWKYVDTLVKYAPVQIGFSIDAVTAETHAQMRPGVGFERTVGAIEEYLEKVKRAAVKPKNLCLQILVTELNNHEVEPFIEYWLPKVGDIPGGHLFVKCVCPWPYHEANVLYPSPKPLLQSSHPKVSVAEFDTPPRFRESCNLFDGFAQVMSDGAYVPCCMPVHDPWGIGNVKNATLSQLYSSEKMRGLRTMDKTQIPFCKDCL